MRRVRNVVEILSQPCVKGKSYVDNLAGTYYPKLQTLLFRVGAVGMYAMPVWDKKTKEGFLDCSVNPHAQTSGQRIPALDQVRRLLRGIEYPRRDDLSTAVPVPEAVLQRMGA